MQDFLKEALCIDNLTDEELRGLCLKSGRVFKGYLFNYHYAQLDGTEVVLGKYATAFNDENEPLNEKEAPLRFSHTSSSFMKFRIVKFPTYGNGDPINPKFIRCSPYLPGNIFDAPIPLFLIHADVLPSFIPFDDIVAQVTLVADQISIFSKDNAGRSELGSPTGFVAYDAFSMCSDMPEHQSKQVTIRGEIVDVAAIVKGAQPPILSDDKIIFYIKTGYGILEVVSRRSKLRKVDIKNLDIGNTVNVSGWLVGDPAENEYQDGAIYDEEHLTRLFFSCTMLYQIKRFTRALSPKCALSFNGQRVADGREDVINALRKYCYLEMPYYITVKGAHKNACYKTEQKGIVCLNKGEQTGNLVFLKFENSQVKEILVDSSLSEYEFEKTLFWEQWRDPSFVPAKYKYEEQQGSSQDNSEETTDDADASDVCADAPLGGKHDESLQEVLQALYKNDLAEFKDKLTPIFESGTINQSNGLKSAEHSREVLPIETNEPNPTVTGLIEKGEADDSYTMNLIFPKLCGDTIQATVGSTYAWKDQLGGEIDFSIDGLQSNFSAFVSYFYKDELFLTAGKQVSFDLAGVALSMRKAENQEITVQNGPFYKFLLEDFLQKNPDKTEDDFEAPRVSLSGGSMFIPTKWACYFEYRSPIIEVEKLKFLDSFVYRVKVVLLRDSDDHTLEVNLYIGQEALGSYAPKAGDDVEGVLWLQVRRNESSP